MRSANSRRALEPHTYRLVGTTDSLAVFVVLFRATHEEEEKENKSLPNGAALGYFASSLLLATKGTTRGTRPSP